MEPAITPFLEQTVQTTRHQAVNYHGKEAKDLEST